MARAIARFAPLRARLVALAERKLPALTRLRRPEPLPIVLDRRRIYVVPTGYGVVFALLAAVMLTGALNYGNNPALLLTCLLGGACFVSVFVSFRGLSGLRLGQVRGGEAHAGSEVAIELVFAPGRRDRLALRATAEPAETAFAAERGHESVAVLAMPAPERGWFLPGRMRIATTFPLGMFVVWSWVHPDVSVLIYPKPEPDAPPLPHGGEREGAHRAGEAEDDPAGLRDYRDHDPPRRIAWRASVRHERLLAREHERQAGLALVLDYDALHGLDHEGRISRLTSWVLQASDGREAFVLVLPGQSIGPAIGAGHRADCLRALALLPIA